MIIVKMASGLANQMYSYAAGYALARELNRELVLDVSACANAQGGGFCLDNFNIPLHRKVKYDLVDLGCQTFVYCGSELDNFPDAVVAVRTLEEKNNYPNSKMVLVYSGLEMAQELIQHPVIYMTGYFFDPNKYFLKYWAELASYFTLRTENDEVREFKNKIAGKVSVGVHVRRGDMLLAEWASTIEDEYYLAAIELYKEMYPGCVFCVFSDDIAYTKEVFGYDESIYYIHFEGFDEASLNELMCLTMCDHRVISNNSTFGRIADDLNYRKTRHIVYRDITEATIGINIEAKKKEQRILLNKDDIQRYSQRFVKKEAEKKEEKNKLDIFRNLVEKQQWHAALQFTQEYYFVYRTQEIFIEGLNKCLVAIGAEEEGVLELFNLQFDKFKAGIANKRPEEQERLFALYQNNTKGKNRRYIIVCNEKMHVAGRLSGLTSWSVPLTHLGNKVSIVYEPDSENAAFYLKNEHLYSTRGIDLGCTHFDKECILDEGVSLFYNRLPEEELVVISRDCRFFVREGVEKNLIFVTTDLSDRDDAELGTLYKEGIHLLHEMELADYVLTLDERFKELGNGFIYCNDVKDSGMKIYDTLWGYGDNLRMQDKVIKMVYSLLLKCNHENR